MVSRSELFRECQAALEAAGIVGAEAIICVTGQDESNLIACQLAKRQDTWFRHQATAIYVEPTVESVRACWRAHGPWTVSFPEHED